MATARKRDQHGNPSVVLRILSSGLPLIAITKLRIGSTLTRRIMQDTRNTLTKRGRTNWISIVCVAFVLQCLLLPMHLAWGDHIHPSTPQSAEESSTQAYIGLDVCSGEAHSHSHTAAPEDDSESDRIPHCVEDHLADFVSPLPPPTVQLLSLIEPRVVCVHIPSVCGYWARVQPRLLDPRPPPPLSALAPRAPPVCL